MKALKTITIALIALIASLPATYAETRRALVIGLGRQLDPAWNKINGDRDVPLVTDMLVRNGFSDIATLINTAATKAAIVAQLQALADRAEPGDLVYVHFSGHGQRVTDLDGDEADGLDEAWIPYDAFQAYSATYHGEKHLTDDEVGRYMSAIHAKVGANGTVAVVVDACHSGDSTRAFTPGDEEDAVRGVYRDFVIPAPKPQRRQPYPETWITLSACQDYQFNQEYRGVGKLTHILVHNWQNYADLDNAALLRAVTERMQSRLYKGRFPQTPAMTGQMSHLFSRIFRAPR